MKANTTTEKKTKASRINIPAFIGLLLEAGLIVLWFKDIVYGWSGFVDEVYSLHNTFGASGGPSPELLHFVFAGISALVYLNCGFRNRQRGLLAIPFFHTLAQLALVIIVRFFNIEETELSGCTFYAAGIITLIVCAAALINCFIICSKSRKASKIRKAEKKALTESASTVA